MFFSIQVPLDVQITKKPRQCSVLATAFGGLSGSRSASEAPQHSSVSTTAAASTTTLSHAQQQQHGQAASTSSTFYNRCPLPPVDIDTEDAHDFKAPKKVIIIMYRCIIIIV